MNLAELTISLKLWQQRLKLMDWQIYLEIRRIWDMKDDDSGRTYHGKVDILLEQKAARISLLDPDDYPPTCWSEDDLEETLVHELLHLHFKALEPEEETHAYWVAQEQAINALAHALVTLARQAGN